MAKKPSKKISKITHVTLSPKDGERFDFSKPYDAMYENTLLLAPKIESSITNTYIDIPEFLQFKTGKESTQKIANPQLENLPEVHTEQKQVPENKVLEIEKNSNYSPVKDKLPEVVEEEYIDTSTSWNGGAFANYFEENKVFDLYRKKANIKSITVAVLSTSLFLGILVFSFYFSLINFALLLLCAFLYVIVTSFFFIIVVDKLTVNILILSQFALLLLFAAVIGMISVITIGIALLAAVLLTLAFRETERQQVINRLFDIYHVTRPANKILHIALAFVIALCFSSLYSVRSPVEFYQSIIPQSSVIKILKNADSNDSQIVRLAEQALDIQAYPDFVKDHPVPEVRDFLIKYDASNQPSRLLSKSELSVITNSFELTPEQKAQAISDLQDEKLQVIQSKNYRMIEPVNTLLTSNKYYSYSYQKALNTVTQSTVEVPNFSQKWLEVQTTFPGIIIGLLVAILYFVVKTLYSILNAVLNFFGLSVEKILWWVLVKSGVVRVETEQLDAEIIVV